MTFKRLPHVHAPGMTQHVVFCTAGAWRGDLDDEALGRSGEACTLTGSVADIVQGVLLRRHGVDYVLEAWCVMPNHVHVLVSPYKHVELARLLGSWKSVAGREAGIRPMWQKNYFDRYMREEEQLKRTIDYIELNPVAAGLTDAPWKWRWSSAYRQDA